MGVSDSRIRDEGKRIWKLAQAGDSKTIRNILSHPDSFHLLEWRHPVSSMTPLMIAAKTGHHDIVEMLVQAGANIDAQSENDGFTAIHYAAHKNRTTCIRSLLHLGANPHIWSHDGHTPLDISRLRAKNLAASLLMDNLTIHSGTLSIRSQGGMLWKKRWFALLKANDSNDRFELAMYASKSDVVPRKVIFLNPMKHSWSHSDKKFWNDKKNMFKFDQPIPVYRVKLGEYSRSSTVRARYKSQRQSASEVSSTCSFQLAAEDHISLMKWISLLDGRHNAINVEPQSNSPRSVSHDGQSYGESPPPYALFGVDSAHSISDATPIDPPFYGAHSLFPSGSSPSSSAHNSACSIPQYHEVCCVECGVDIENNDGVCTQCGAEVLNNPDGSSKQNSYLSGNSEKSFGEQPAILAPESVTTSAPSAPPMEYVTESYSHLEVTSNQCEENEVKKDCIVCMDAVRNTVAVPCGHLSSCYDCLQELKVGSGCPICRAKIASIVRVYEA